MGLWTGENIGCSDMWTSGADFTKWSCVNFSTFLVAQIVISYSSHTSSFSKGSTSITLHSGHIATKKMAKILLCILDSVPVAIHCQAMLFGVTWKLIENWANYRKCAFSHMIVLWINFVLPDLNFKISSILICHSVWKLCSAKGNLVKTLHLIENTSLKLRSLNCNRMVF